MTKTIKFLLLISINLLAYSFSAKIEVENYLATEMEFIFEIENKNFNKVVVDCQGFINNVGVEFQDGSKAMLILDIGECDEIHEQIVTNLQESASACLYTDFDRRSYYVSKTCD